VINPFLYDIAGFSVSPDTCKLSYLQQIEHEATASAGTISAFGAQSAQGTLWDVLRGFLDVGPWTELFIEDRPEVMDDPKRPAAWCWSIATTLQGSGPGEGLHHAPAHQAGHAGGRRRVGDRAEIGRSDANVANYFQVNMPRMNLIDAATMNLSGQSTNPDDFYLDEVPQRHPKLYGLRFMEADTQMGGADSLGRVDGQSAEAVKREQRKVQLWIDERRAQLMAQNKDNVVFEDGSITLRGQATLRPGMYLRIQHGPPAALQPFVWECYVVAVQHRMVPYQGFVTVATFERGTMFAERIRRGAGLDSAYLAEWNQGGRWGDQNAAATSIMARWRCCRPAGSISRCFP
jgi:hypothetical protein